MDSHEESEAVHHTPPATSEGPSLRPMWRTWALMLRRHGLHGIAALFIEAGRPLSLVSAQLLYAGQPFLGGGASQLAQLLESEAETEAFLELLNPRTDASNLDPRGIV